MSPFRSASLIRFLSLCSCTSLVLSTPVVSSGPTVTLASGIVIGTTTRPTNQPSLTAQANAYLGIPFAKSPPERFSPPEAAASWSSPLYVQTIKPACIQQFTGTESAQNLSKQYLGNPNSSPPEESEDCLHLNVYTPSNVTSLSKKAVMFWIYGGSLQFGTGGLPYYDGSSLAITQDVIVVTINYRTNIFGFSNSPEIPFGDQNSGFLDQRFALQWVQDNIAQFGGDPSHVMIYGESAGGESVKQLLANPPSPLPFSSAILESEQALLLGDGLLNYQQVLVNFNCAGAPSPIACLRRVPATDLKAYIEPNSLAFPPVDGDGTSTSDVRASISTRQWARVPAMLGTNLNEARVFLAVFGVNNGTAAIDTVFSLLGIKSSTLKQSILALYAARGITDPYLVADRIFTDMVFTCTTSTLSTYLASNGYATYRYRYDASFPTTSIFANAGAYHMSEIPEVFGTYPLSNQFGTATQQQIQLSGFMQNVWANFAKNAYAGVGWPKIGSALGNELGVLGASGSSGVTARNTAVADYPCGLYIGLEGALALSY